MSTAGVRDCGFSDLMGKFVQTETGTLGYPQSREWVHLAVPHLHARPGSGGRAGSPHFVFKLHGPPLIYSTDTEPTAEFGFFFPTAVISYKRCLLPPNTTQQLSQKHFNLGTF